MDTPIINWPLIHIHVYVFLAQKRGQKSEKKRLPQAAGWLAADVACVADIGRSGGQQPVIMGTVR